MPQSIPIALTCIRHGETLYNRTSRIQGNLDVPLSEKGVQQAEKLGSFIKSNLLRAQQSDSVCFVPPPEIMICSPLLRAKRTAQEVHKHAEWDHIELQEHDALKEICFGSCEGYLYVKITQSLLQDPVIQKLIGVKTLEQFHRNSASNWNTIATFWKSNPDYQFIDLEDDRELKPSTDRDMETQQDLVRRSDEFIQHIGDLASRIDRTENLDRFVRVVAVSHGFYLRVLLTYIMYSTGGAQLLPMHLFNTSVSTMTFKLTRKDESSPFAVEFPEIKYYNSYPHLQ